MASTNGGGRIGNVAPTRTAPEQARQAAVTAAPTAQPAGLDLERISSALGPAPPVSYAAAHAYPAAAPAYVSQPFAQRPACGDGRLRLYVHIPFCNYSCSFCFFAIRVDQRRDQMVEYVAALKKELGWIVPGTPLSQLFMGGGTPTTLPADLLDDLLSHLFARVDRSGEQVHTVEASPDSLTEDHMDVLRGHDIGRVSMGIQSLDEAVLERTRRGHGGADALSACEQLVDYGFIVNIDLMYGLPGQTEAQFQRDFEEIARRGVHSVTVYDLRLNERTTVRRDLDERERLEIGRLIRWRQVVKGIAEAAGYAQTRWHTFKRMDTVAFRHERAPHHRPDGHGYQFGAGMSATSHLGDTVYRNHLNMNAYIRRVAACESPVEEVLPLQIDDRRTLFVARSLGDGKPLDSAAYAECFGTTIEEDYGPVLVRLRTGGLIADDGRNIVLTDVGRLVHDRVTYNFYPPRVLRWLSQRAPSAAGVQTP